MIHTRNIQTEKKKKQNHHFTLPRSLHIAKWTHKNEEENSKSNNSKTEEYIEENIVKTMNGSSFLDIWKQGCDRMVRENEIQRIWSMSYKEMKWTITREYYSRLPQVKPRHEISHLSWKQRNTYKKRDKEKNTSTISNPTLIWTQHMISSIDAISDR